MKKNKKIKKKRGEESEKGKKGKEVKICWSLHLGKHVDRVSRE